MNKADRALADKIIAHQIQLMRFTAGEKKKVFNILMQMQTELKAKLLNGLTTYEKGRVQKIMNECTAIINTYYSGIQAKMDLPGIAKTEAAATTKTMASIGIEGSMPAPSVLKAMVSETLLTGAPLKDWWAKLGDDVSFKVVSQVRQGVAQGEGLQDIITRVVGNPKKGIPGVLEASRRNASTLVHDTVMQITNDAKMAVYRENADVTKGVQQLSTLDSRTSEICIAYSGAQWDLDGNPINGTTLPFDGGCPRHPNCVALGEMVMTDHGNKPIEDIKVGDLVLTHRNRFKPVTTVFRKQNESGIIRIIHTESGDIIRVTDEHPILTMGRGWLCANMIKVGDKLFQHDNEPVPIGVGLFGSERNPNNNPATRNGVGVSNKVFGMAGIMPMAVNFNDNLTGMKRKITDGFALNELAFISNTKGIKVKTKKCLTHGSILQLARFNMFQDAFNRARQKCGVIFSHAFRVASIEWRRFFCETIRPVFFSGHSPSGLQLCEVFPGTFALGSGFNTMPFAPTLDNGFANSKFAFNSPQGFPKSEMMLIDKSFKSGAISKVDHFDTSSINDIQIVAYHGDVVNLEVEEDHTFLVNGIITHNCRSVLVPILVSYKELGIDVPEIAGTRASDLGQIPADTSFDTFLKRHDTQYQDELLGPGKAKLWRSGKITLRDLINQDGRTITLKELQAGL